MQNGMKSTIVLVHGSWQWGGCFQKVANLLGEAGYPVITPDLTSHGYSAVPYDGFGTMAEYVAPVEEILRRAKEPIVLLGHSMGGATVNYLAERYPEKIARLFYLSAFMTPKGKSARDYILLNANYPACRELFELRSLVNGGRGEKLDLDRRDLVKAALYGDCSEHDIDIASRNVLETTSTVPDHYVSEISTERFGRIPRVYVECTEDKAIPIETQRLMMSDVPGAIVRSLRSHHCPNLSQPENVARIILEHA